MEYNIKLNENQYRELTSALEYAVEQRYYEADVTTDQEDATAIRGGANTWEGLLDTVRAAVISSATTLIKTKTIIIRGGSYGEDINGVLTVKNPDGKCSVVVSIAAKKWNEMDIKHPGWLPYMEYIKDELKNAGYIFEDTQFEAVEDWDES